MWRSQRELSPFHSGCLTASLSPRLLAFLLHMAPSPCSLPPSPSQLSRLNREISGQATQASPSCSSSTRWSKRPLGEEGRIWHLRSSRPERWCVPEGRGGWVGGWRGDGLKVGWGQQLVPGRRPPGLKSQPYHCLARPSPLPAVSPCL